MAGWLLQVALEPQPGLCSGRGQPAFGSRTRAQSGLERKAARAGAELIDLRTIELGDPEQQVGRRFLLGRDVPIAFQLAMRAADQQCRRVSTVMGITVASAAAEID